MPLTQNTSINYKIIEKQISSVDLVLVDLDGVIMNPLQYLCSSHWYVNYLKTLDIKNQDINFKTTIVDMLYYCLYSTKFEAVDDQLISTLNKYSYNMPIIGLTGRIISFKHETQAWIDELGISFTNCSYKVNFKSNHSILSKGVIYVGHDLRTTLPWNKGEALGKFLEVYPTKINKILFIDDMLGNHDNISKFCKKSNIEFHGLYYTKVAHHYNNTYSDLDLELIGKIQFDFFYNYNTFISDENAYSILHTSMCTNNELEFLN